MRVRVRVRANLNPSPIPNQLLPPMRVVVAAGDGEVTIKVADEGGGLPRSRLRGVWSYRGR